MGKIATRSDCNGIISGAFSSDLSKCPTKSEIKAAGNFDITGSYVANQLVQLSDLSVLKEIIAYGDLTGGTGGQGVASLTLSGQIPSAFSFGVGAAYFVDNNTNGQIAGVKMNTVSIPAGATSGSIVFDKLTDYFLYKNNTVVTMGSTPTGYTIHCVPSDRIVSITNSGPQPTPTPTPTVTMSADLTVEDGGYYVRLTIYNISRGINSGQLTIEVTFADNTKKSFSCSPTEDNVSTGFMEVGDTSGDHGEGNYSTGGSGTWCRTMHLGQKYGLTAISASVKSYNLKSGASNIVLSF